MPYMKNPLQEAHCKDMAYVIQRFPYFRTVLEKLERCGFPCQEQLAAVEAAFGACSKARAEFDPMAAPLPPLPEDYQPVKITDQQCRDLDSVMSEYPGLKETIAAFERCGFPCAEALDSLERHYHICSNLKKEFLPQSV
jgi:hypothetical protein